MVRELLQSMGYVVKERDWYIERSWINVQLWEAVANATNMPFGLAICAGKRYRLNNAIISCWNIIRFEYHVCLKAGD